MWIVSFFSLQFCIFQSLFSTCLSLVSVGICSRDLGFGMWIPIRISIFLKHTSRYFLTLHVLMPVGFGKAIIFLGLFFAAFGYAGYVYAITKMNLSW
jgi:hypothetical protein